MPHRYIIGPMLAILFFLGAFKAVNASEMLEVREILHGGSINWSLGLIHAKGVKQPEGKSLGKAMDRLEALATAKDSARDNLLEILKEIRVDSSHTLGQIFANNDVIMAKAEAMAREAPVVRKAYLTDGTVEVTIEMAVDGGFAQLVLPEEIKQIEAIKTVSTEEPGAQPGKKKGAGPVPASVAVAYTGLVVDARGLELKPTMCPRIYDESGQEVYGSTYVSREFAVQHGLVRYVKNLQAAVLTPRVADNPLTVKGLRTTQPGHYDIIISTADASRIRGHSEHLSFLKKCRVLVVVE
jgi:hypothetical protein